MEIYSILDASGTQLRAWWRWQTAFDNPLLRLNAFSFIEGPAQMRAEDAIASVGWARADKREVRRKIRLELTTEPDSRQWWTAPFAGEFQRAGERSLIISGPDLTAFAAGASRLFIIVREENGQIVDRVEVKPRAVVDGFKKIETELASFRARAADYKRQCIPTDDVIERAVII